MILNEILLIASILLISAIIFNKIGGKFGVPSLVIFILVGILAGSDGILGIYFEDFTLAQFVGIVAISYILFMGGLSVNIKELKPVVAEGSVLATLGVFATGIIVGLCSYFLLDLPMLECMLLGAIISSTDAAAVFGVLRSKNISLDYNLKPLLEFESGSNDPMAVFLTLGVIGLITGQLDSLGLVFDFFKQMLLGIAFGYLIARGTAWIINRIRLEYDSLYVVITLASVLFTYSFISIIGGNGFIGVYICGLALASMKFVNKKTLIKFHDAVAWLMQIVMFLILGLLVNFKDGFAYTKQAFLIALILTFVARPIAVFLTTFPFKRSLKEKLMISWVGLRGAAPIVLATFPLTENVPHAMEIFNIVFFVVIISVLLQGTTIPYFAKLLKVDAPLEVNHDSVLEYGGKDSNNKMIEFTVADNAEAAGKQLFELNLPQGALVSLIYKNGEYIIPTGSTTIEPCDVLFVLMDKTKETQVRKIICTEKNEEA
ncbi:TPA: potassium/proton antiporter [Candidatus Gastranaerophilales bacterium HUM_20]|nr:transporter monovalent cation:proton antiporter-2 (CPA2) family [Clostridium sp. CAG:729]DAB21175.1 MAG TPA: potassium/proton antiporter [Candidatus Gastranaerophilales bacterium HUM_20]